MRRTSAEPGMQGQRVAVLFVALGIACVAMAALHLVQPDLDPLARAVSFYVWGAHGWLLPVALGALGVALLALARTRAAPPAVLVALAGGALLLSAAFPSDRWFPWEGPASVSGLVHAAAGVIAPALLVWPMAGSARRRDTRPGRAVRWSVALYVAALLGATASLALGFWRDGAPPWIGLAERTMTAAAICWVCALAREARVK